MPPFPIRPGLTLAAACLVQPLLFQVAAAQAAPAAGPAPTPTVTISAEKRSTLSSPASVTANELADCADSPEAAVANHIASFEPEGDEKMTPEMAKKRLRHMLNLGPAGSSVAEHAREVNYLLRKLNVDGSAMAGAGGVLGAAEGLDAGAGAGGESGEAPSATGGADLLNGCTTQNYARAGRRMAIQLNDKLLPQAQQAYRAGDYAKALPLFKQAYDKVGYDEAALALGSMYLNGQGTARDVKQAIDWYERVAMARGVNASKLRFNHMQPSRASIGVDARIRLANLYGGADPALADPRKSRYWYEQAEDANYVPARYVLARMLETGYGGAADPAKAVRLYRDAAEHGYAPAQFRLAQLYATGLHVQRELKEAYTWFEQVAFHPLNNPNKPAARFAMAEIIDGGIGAPRDPAKAMALYRLAAVAGHGKAMNALATYYYTGEVVERDQELSRTLFIESAKRGDPEAMVNTAVMLVNGQGGPSDPATAYVWSTLASRMGSSKGKAVRSAIEAKLTAEQRQQALTLLGPAAGR